MLMIGWRTEYRIVDDDLPQRQALLQPILQDVGWDVHVYMYVCMYICMHVCLRYYFMQHILLKQQRDHFKPLTAMIMIRCSYLLTVTLSSMQTWSYPLTAAMKVIDVTSSKQWIHFFLSLRCPPTSMILRYSMGLCCIVHYRIECIIVKWCK